MVLWHASCLQVCKNENECSVPTNRKECHVALLEQGGGRESRLEYSELTNIIFFGCFILVCYNSVTLNSYVHTSDAYSSGAGC